MQDVERRPYLSSYLDRHDKKRWRFRRDGKTVPMRGEPGEDDFEEAYNALLEGREPRKAVVVPHPGATVPKSFKDAWQRVLRTPEWIRHDEATKEKNTRLASEFMTMKVVDEAPDQWGDMAVADIRRRHLKDLLGRLSATPHKAKHMLVTWN
ncbi:MAG: hypothetical protein EOO82_00440 [Oxalobacteraceae bacterium]|nr:MAG: hypothetical protein EOO82_00440 [Oxalobacteraceae bacterium]